MESARLSDQLDAVSEFLKHSPSTAGMATDPARVVWAARTLCQDAGIKVTSGRTERGSASTYLYDASAARSHAGIAALKPLLQSHRRRTLSALQCRHEAFNGGERVALLPQPETALQCALDAAAAPYHPGAEGLVSASTEPICRRELHHYRLAAYSELLARLIEQVRLAEQAAMQSVKAAAKAVRKQGRDAAGSVGSARSLQQEAVIRFAYAASSLRRERSAAPAPPAAVPATELSSGVGSGEHRPRASRPAAQAGNKRPRPDFTPGTGSLHVKDSVGGLSNGQGLGFAGGGPGSNKRQARGHSLQERGPGNGEAGASHPQPELGRPAPASGSKAPEGGLAGAGPGEATSAGTARAGTQRHRGGRRLPPRRPGRGSARSLASGAPGRASGRARSRGPSDGPSEGGLQDAVSFF